MILNKIEIFGFKNEDRNIAIEFKDEITIMYGMNGSGKTTILKILNAVLAQKEEVLKKESVKRINLTYTIDKIQDTVTIKYNEKKNSYDWKDIISTNLMNSKSMLIGVQRGVNLNNINVHPSLIYDFFTFHNSSRSVLGSIDRTRIKILAEELTEFINKHKIRGRRNIDIIPEGRHIILEEVNINTIENALQFAFQNVKRKISQKVYSALFETFALAIDIDNLADFEIPKNIDEIIFNNKTKLIEALNDSPENEFKHLVIEKITNYEKGSSDLGQNKLFAKLLLKILEELDSEKQELLTINTLIGLFNSLLSENKKIVIDKDGIYIEVKNIDANSIKKEFISTHNLSELSSGERHLLTFLTAILIDGSSRDFILIDEPEISLNILWQEKLVSIINRMAPNTQLIIASHSQSIAQDHLKSLVEIKQI